MIEEIEEEWIHPDGREITLRGLKIGEWWFNHQVARLNLQIAGFKLKKEVIP